MMIIDRLWILGLAVVFAFGIFAGRVTAPQSHKDESQKAEAILPDTGMRPSSVHPTISTKSAGPLYELVSSEDFEDMARAAAASSDSVDHESMLHVLVSEWAKKDPRAAIAFAQERQRSDLISDGLLQWARHSPDDALLWVEQNEGKLGQKRYFKMAVYRGMAKADPVEVVARVEQLPPGAQHDELLAITIDEWAQQDVYSTFDWLETTKLSPQFSNIYSQVMSRYIEQDPVSVAVLISDMQYFEEKVRLASQVAVKLAEADVGYALDWVDTLPDDNSKKYALQGVIDRWSKGEDAKAALQYVMAADANTDSENLFSNVAINLSYKNLDLLTEAFDQMSEAQQLISAQKLATVFSVDHPDRGIEWVRSLAPGVVQDATIESTLRTYKNPNVAEAFELSKSISDDSVRKKQMREVLKVWIPVDQQAAERALNAPSLIVSSEKEVVLNEVYLRLKSSDYIIPVKP